MVLKSILCIFMGQINTLQDCRSCHIPAYLFPFLRIFPVQTPGPFYGNSQRFSPVLQFKGRIFRDHGLVGFLNWNQGRIQFIYPFLRIPLRKIGHKLCRFPDQFCILLQNIPVFFRLVEQFQHKNNVRLLPDQKRRYGRWRVAPVISYHLRPSGPFVTISRRILFGLL